MSVYIKGFPLPNNCGACPLRLAWCRERIYMVTRPDRCPLVPAPEHGRLIDADALLKGTTNLHVAVVAGWLYVRTSAIEDAPTIIPADPAEEETE